MDITNTSIILSIMLFYSHIINIIKFSFNRKLPFDISKKYSNVSCVKAILLNSQKLIKKFYASKVPGVYF